MALLRIVLILDLILLFSLITLLFFLDMGHYNENIWGLFGVLLFFVCPPMAWVTYLLLVDATFGKIGRKIASSMEQSE